MANNNRSALALAICSVLTLQGCQTLPGYWHEETNKEIQKALSETGHTTGTIDIPPAVDQALLPPMTAQLDHISSVITEERFDLNVNNALARNVFTNLVADSPYNVAVHPSVKGRISLNLKNVTIDEAFNIIQNSYGFDYELKGNQYYVYGKGITTRIYHVNQLNMIRNGSSQTSISTSELGQQGESKNGVNTTTTSDFWALMRESLGMLVGSEGGRSSMINPQAGLIIVKAPAADQRMVQKYIYETHRNLHKQVILEAKIIEVELSEGFQAGINWGLFGSNSGVNFAGSQIGSGSLNAGNMSLVNGVSSTLGALNNNSIIQSPVGGIIGIAAGKSNFGGLLEMLGTQGNAHVLSSPRIATTNNQKAIIKVGSDEYFVTGTSFSTPSRLDKDGNEIPGAAPGIETEALFSGIALDVTPQIDDEDNITLHLHPSISEVTQIERELVLEGEPFSLPLAASEVRESDNIVRAKNGQVIVVGGLMKEKVVNNESKVPLLGDIPLIGNLFKHKNTSKVKKELVILLKPTIVHTSEIWEEELGKSKQRLSALD